MVQEISCRQKAKTPPTPTGSTPKTICPPPLRRGGGHKILLPGQLLIANHSNWTVTVYVDTSSCVDDSKQMDCDEGMSSLEKSLHNLSLDIAPDDETYIASTNLSQI